MYTSSSLSLCLLTDYPSRTFVRNVTTQRKSEQAKNIRSHSVPSLNSTDINKQPSPSRQPRSNSVRAPPNFAKKFSFRRRIAKIFGSHSDLSGKSSTISDQQSCGVYRPLGGFRPQSIGGSSDCSSSSLTSAPQQSDFSRHNSLRDSSRSRISQNSVFSSRQASCDSTDFNYTVHGNTVPSESTLRPRSIACMQRSGSSSSLKNNLLHGVNSDPRYFSLAALPPRVDTTNSHVHSVDDRTLNITRGGHRGLHRNVLPHDDLDSFEETGSRVKPSDPGYKKVAENLMTCSPQEFYTQQRLSDPSSDMSSRKVSGEFMDEMTYYPRNYPPSPVTPIQSRGQEERRSCTPGKRTIITFYYDKCSY